MFLKQSRSNGKIFLSLVQGYRQDGKVKHKTIEKLGYLDDLKNEHADPVAYFREVAKKRTEETPVEHTVTIDANQQLLDNMSSRKNLGYAIPKRIYSILGIRDFLQTRQKHLQIEYNLNAVFSLLVYNRFFAPSSKKRAFEGRDFFFESCHFSLDDMYRALDYFTEYSTALQKHLHGKVGEMFGHEDELGYYDVTNYYFEIPYGDENEHDENGSLIKKGFRHNGPSKENRHDPIVQMGLLMDSRGFPMAFNTFSGGTSEKVSLLPTIRRVKKDYGLQRIIVVADRGLNTSDNTAFLSGINNDDYKGNDGYVYGQSVLGADKAFKAWVLAPSGYIYDKEKDKDGNDVVFQHKSRIFAKPVQLKNSKGERKLKMDIYQKQMVYYSEKYAKKQRRQRELVLAKANDLIANPGRYTKSTCFGAAGYIKNIRFVKSTGEIPDGLDLSLDLEKIAEEENFDGYYSIVTSEKHLPDCEIRNIYKGLWEIEESFKILKSEFRARPIYLKKENHIHAHFLICFVALLILRIIEIKLNAKYPVNQIRESLIRYSCSHLDQNYYLFDYRDEILKDIEQALSFDLGKKIMTMSEIKKILQYQPHG